MIGESAQELGLRLVSEELGARRCTEGTKNAVLRAITDFYRWASRQGKGDVRSFGKKELSAFFAHLCRQTSKRTGEACGRRRSIYASKRSGSCTRACIAQGR
jgi:hypothetical protein